MFYFSATLYIKAEVLGYHTLIINKVLRVPYSSKVELICKGSGKLSWHYKNTTLEQFKNITQRIIAYTNENSQAIVTIVGFGRTDMGFYTCRNVYEDFKMEKTILVTSCKFLLM